MRGRAAGRRKALRRSVVAASAIGLAVFLGQGPVLAQPLTFEGHYEVCAGFAFSAPGEQIASCTWLLDNGGLDPRTRATVHLSRAIAYNAAREVDRAHADFDRAIDLDPGLIGAHGLKHALLMRHGRFREALAVATRWISVEPSAVAYEKRGMNRILIGDRAGGESDYAEALSRTETADEKAQVGMRVCGYLATTLAALGWRDDGATAAPCADMLALSQTSPARERGFSLDTSALAAFARNGRAEDDPEVLSLLAEARRLTPEIPPPSLRVEEFDRRIRQRALQLLGLWPGDADGQAGPETRQAIADLQRRNNLPVSGTFDAATAETLERLIADRFSR